MLQLLAAPELASRGRWKVVGRVHCSRQVSLSRASCARRRRRAAARPFTHGCPGSLGLAAHARHANGKVFEGLEPFKARASRFITPQGTCMHINTHGFSTHSYPSLSQNSHLSANACCCTTLPCALSGAALNSIVL